MKYLQLICIEGETGTPEAATAMREHVGPWVEQTKARGVNIIGKPLDDPATAKTVRVRDGQTLVTDGPFADIKEYIGGLDLLDCESLDEAIEVAAQHPVSWFHAIELRPFPAGVEIPEIPYDELRYLIQFFADGQPEPPDVEEAIQREGEAWRGTAGDAMIFGNGLQPKQMATTVRVRDGQVLLTDGPFVDTKEFLAGVCLMRCESEQEAIDLAAEFPLTRYHMAEVRRFIDL